MFYHGSSSKILSGEKLLPPETTGLMQETGRLKNTDKVFFTTDIGLAKIYAGRACRKFGGEPIVVRVIPFDNEIECLSDVKGASVFMAPSAFIEYGIVGE